MKIKTLPLDNFPDSGIVARRLTGETVDWQSFKTSINVWQQKISLSKSKYIAAYHNNGLEFLTLLFAIWAENKTAIIPANTLPATLSSVGTYTDTFIGEFPEGAIPTNVKEINPSDKENYALVIFTSGSTGEPEAISKTFTQLNAELKILNKYWEIPYDSLTAGTVSHHHMYGLPFRLLWPIVSSTPFLAQEIAYIEQLNHVKSENIRLITSPAHLERLPNMVDLDVKKNVGQIFSAGSPLSESAAVEGARFFGIDVTEIYGSTETGAAAWRIQSKNSNWQVFSEIKIRTDDNKLSIRANTISNQKWFTTQDICELHGDGEFSLIGRADNIIKLGGKRISSQAIVRALQEHELVEEAKAIILHRRKSRLGAVIRLTHAGSKKLVDLGNRALTLELLKSIQSKFEPVARPRYWRFVAAMPIDKQGKVTAAELAKLFDKQNNILPEVIETQKGDDPLSVTIHFNVGHDLLYLQGHFPSQPILPGVSQITWAQFFGAQHFGHLGKFKALEVIKFQHVIQPGATIKLALNWNPIKCKLQFSFSSGELIHSSGRIAFHATGEAQ